MSKQTFRKCFLVSFLCILFYAMLNNSWAQEKKYPSGTHIEALIMRTEPERKKVYLSLKAVLRAREREELAKYMKTEEDSRTTIGDLLQNVIDRKK